MVKKTAIFLVIAFLVSLVSVPVFAQEKVKLSFKGVASEKIIYQAKNKISGSLSLEGIPIPNLKINVDDFQMTNESIVQYKVLQVDKDGNILGQYKTIPVKLNFSDILVISKIKKFEKLFQEHEGVVKISSLGKLLSIEPKITPKEKKATIKKQKDGTKKDLKKKFKRSHLPKEAISKLLTQLMPNFFPENPVSVGESWNSTVELSKKTKGLFSDIEAKFTLRNLITEPQRQVAVIDYTSKFSFGGQFFKILLAAAKPFNLGEKKLNLKDLDLNYLQQKDGTIYFDVTNGHVIKVEGKSAVRLTGLLMLSPVDNDKITWPVKVDLKVNTVDEVNTTLWLKI